MLFKQSKYRWAPVGRGPVRATTKATWEAGICLPTKRGALLSTSDSSPALRLQKLCLTHLVCTQRVPARKCSRSHRRISAMVDQLTRDWITMAQVSQHACITLAGRQLRTVRIRGLFTQRRFCKRHKDELCWRYDLVSNKQVPDYDRSQQCV